MTLSIKYMNVKPPSYLVPLFCSVKKTHLIIEMSISVISLIDDGGHNANMHVVSEILTS